MIEVVRKHQDTMVTVQHKTQTDPSIRLLLRKPTQKYINKWQLDEIQTALMYGSVCLMTVCCGCLETLGGTLYINLEQQLNTTSSYIAYMLSIKAIWSAIGSVVSALILQYVQTANNYLSIMALLTAITIAIMPYVTSVYFMFIIFAIIGSFIGITCVTYPVYIFRLYPQHQNRALFGCTVIYGISKTLSPLLIDLSILMSKSYAPVLYIMAILLVLLTMLYYYFPTPKHDELRNTPLSSESSHIDYGTIYTKIVENKRATLYSRILFILFALIIFSFSAFQSGLVNFIQKFISVDLGENPSIARYMISSYYFGQLFYRLCITVLFRNLDPVKSMIIGNICLMCCGVPFIMYSNYIWLLYVIYINIGFWSSIIAPGTLRWTELIKSVSGLLSGLYVVAFSIGDASMVTFMGTLIDLYGIHIFPIPICLYITFCLFSTIIAAILYHRYSSIKNQIFESLDTESINV